MTFVAHRVADSIDFGLRMDGSPQLGNMEQARTVVVLFLFLALSLFALFFAWTKCVSCFVLRFRYNDLKRL